MNAMKLLRFFKVQYLPRWLSDRARRSLACWLGWSALGAWALVLTGCALPGFLRFDGSRLDINQLTLAAAANANRNSPIAVDVVLVFDAAMLDRLLDMPADKWFATKADLVKTFPKSLTLQSWELVPGQRLAVVGAALERPRVQGALVYAAYLSSGNHRQRLDPLKGRVVVQLDAQGFDVIAAP